jgi:hypothetical protein
VRREEWAVRVRRLDRKRKGLWQPSATAVICSEHFLQDDFHQQFGRKTVKPNVSRSVFSFAPPKKLRQAPAKRSTGPSPSVSKTTRSDAVINKTPSNESVDSMEALTNIHADHAYAVTSPTILRNQNDLLAKVRNFQPQLLTLLIFLAELSIITRKFI